MKKLLFILLSLPLLATAKIKKGTSYQAFELLPKSGSQFSFVLNKKVKTDGCNQYGLQAVLRPVDRAEGGPTEVYVVDFSVSQTEMACNPPRTPRFEILTSERINVPYDENLMAGATVLVPRNVGIKFREVVE